MSDERRLFLAIGLSIAILLVWQWLFVPTSKDVSGSQLSISESIGPLEQLESSDPSLAVSPTGQNSPNAALANPKSAVLSEELVNISSDVVSGKISAQGAKFSQLALLKYRETIDPTSPAEILFTDNPSEPYYAQFGWSGIGNDRNLFPTANAKWEAETSHSLTPDTPVVLRWDGDAGVSIVRTVSLSDDYMYEIRDEVINRTSAAVSAAPWGLLFREEPELIDSIYILHEGPVGYFDEEGLQEFDYDDFDGPRGAKFESNNGWLGITDKYWAGILIPSQQTPFTATYTRRQSQDRSVIQTDFVSESHSIAPGQSKVVTHRLFAGAKVPSLVNGIADRDQIAGFDLVIDWGIFYFLTKPLAAAIAYFYDLVGNFGISILIVTVIVKIIFFPLAYKSYVAMSRMQKLQPKMLQLREQFGDDQKKLQQAMAQLYRDEKVNPAAGCLPILFQIPVFFSLYKVIYVSILLRHAPFYGWIQDLSAPDPTSLFNLFGLLPFETPALLTIGVWPILMGVTMFIQMQLAPMQTSNPIQRKVFMWLPLIFTFMLATLPSGLILYWVWNNVLSIAQQAYIMRRNGAKIALADNIKSMFRRDEE